jgi:hypothetical protein
VSDAADVNHAQEIPTFVECVIGYRTWIADVQDQLWPIYSARRPWLPGVNTARCNCGKWDSLQFDWSWYEGRRLLEPAPEHTAPDTSCVCGLYSWRRPSKHWYGEPPPRATSEVVGAVASWGRLQVHVDGFRAEHACVVTLAHHPDTHTDELTALERIAAHYRVELVPLSELEEAASKHGTPLPDTLRPPIERPMPAEDPPPETEVAHAPDATSDEVRAPNPVGFDGRSLPSSKLHGWGA